MSDTEYSAEEHLDAADRAIQNLKVQDGQLRLVVEKVRETYDDACNDLLSSLRTGSARDVEIRRYLNAFTDLYEAALRRTAPDTK